MAAGKGVWFMAAGCLALALFGGAARAAQEVKLAVTFDQATPMVQAARKFAELWEGRTGGAYKINIYPGGVMGGEKDNLDALMLGELEMGIFGGMHIATLTPGYSFFDCPFLFLDRDHYLRVINGRLGQGMKDIFADKFGLKYVGVTGRGYRHITSNKPVYGPDDLKGLKMRMGQTKPYLETFSGIGAVTIPIALPELFTSLKMGVVESSEGPYEQIWTYKLQEVQTYIAITGHTYAAAHFVVNKAFYDDLPDRDRKLFDECMAEAMEFGLRRAAEEENVFKSNLEKAGVKFTEAPLKPFIERATPALRKLFAELWRVTTLEEIQGL
ncbi:MAG: TRAP transporter substrate-binding protein [Planctomycetota bacterium]|jgi:tripartite ATP-independent transporter DctP family solute receptor|nr:TRAP transporter substrate-binding protein [Planctomycetota bacterium]